MNKQILKLAIPSILANITIPLVGLVDTAIVGHIADASIIGGIAIGTMLFDLLYWNFGFLRVGTSGMTAQAYGQGDKEGCTRLLAQSLSISAAATAIIWLLQWVFVTIALLCIPSSPAVEDFARQYFYVRVWAAPATLALMAFKGWFIGMQDTVSPMVCDIVVNVVNMVASYGLAVYTPLGAIGVAYGTLIAQYSGLILALTLLMTRYRTYVYILNKVADVLQWQQIRNLLSLNGNLFIRSLCFMVIYVGFTSLSSVYGDQMLAVGSIIMKLFMFFSYFVDGFAYAGEALVGRFIGEVQIGKQHQDELNKVVRLLFIWSLAVGGVFTMVYAVWGIDCVALMTNDTELIAAAYPFLGWLIAMPIISTLAFMWDGIYVGATAGIAIRNAMIWAALGFVIAYAVLSPIWGIQSLYLAYFVHLVARVVYLTMMWRPTRKAIINK